jgi:inhibitor of cysteine peptidase
MKNIKSYLNLILLFLILTLSGMVGYGFYNLISIKSLDYSKVENFSDYNQIYHLLKDINKGYGNRVWNKDIALEASKIDYSDTNLQVIGVQEADVVKTDGNYIYTYASDKIYIVEVNNGELSILSEIKDDNFVNGSIEMYVYENRLVVIINSYMFGIREDIRYGYGANEAQVIVYDITDHSNPIKLNRLTQQGSYISSRMIDNYLYLTTNHYVYDENYRVEDYSKYVPTMYDGEYKNIKPNDIYYMPNPASSSYLVASSIDVNDPSSFKSNKAILGAGGHIYADYNNIIIASYDSKEEGNIVRSTTNLTRFQIEDGNITFKASGMVYGNILNQFSMDIYNNYFRIVTTSYDYKQSGFGNDSVVSIQNNSHNNLYVLDMNLNQVGQIENIAKDERVYSVRFDKEYAYFVTFKQVDPLFSVDLTTPSDPKIIGELKIPGFSDYLHFYSDDLLFGLGREVESDRVIGIKMSMFDLSDKTNVIEKHKLYLGDDYNWSEALYNHKAILVSKDLIGFAVNDEYLLYTFDNDIGFSSVKKIELGNDYFGFNIRGLYIEDHFYIFDGYNLRSYDMNDYNEFDSIKFGKN